jgi:hypothetical protein
LHCQRIAAQIELSLRYCANGLLGSVDCITSLWNPFM